MQILKIEDEKGLIAACVGIGRQPVLWREPALIFCKNCDSKEPDRMYPWLQNSD